MDMDIDMIDIDIYLYIDVDMDIDIIDIDIDIDIYECHSPACSFSVWFLVPTRILPDMTALSFSPPSSSSVDTTLPFAASGWNKALWEKGGAKVQNGRES
jgi:hypothetical protein